MRWIKFTSTETKALGLLGSKTSVDLLRAAVPTRHSSFLFISILFYVSVFQRLYFFVHLLGEEGNINWNKLRPVIDQRQIKRKIAISHLVWFRICVRNRIPKQSILLFLQKPRLWPGLVVLRLNVPVNNFSVKSGRSHRFLGN